MPPAGPLPPETSRDPRVDDLRQQLRSLGYLDAGVDRFVLAPARSARRPSVIALFSSIRIGLIAAVLLGPAAAAAMGARLPGLVTGARDAMVIAIYMSVLFGVAVTILALAASSLVSSFARRAGPRFAARARWLAVAAGVVMSIACVAYLTLWWRTANAGFGWSAPLWTAFALAAAVVMSLLLGHAVMATALAVTVALPADGRATLRMPGLSWRTSILAGMLAFGGAAMLLAATAPSHEETSERPVMTVVPTGLRVRLIAIDGFDTGVYDRLTSTGRLPALTQALTAASARLEIEDSRDPARTWTTIATGQPPAVHGVRGLETRRLAGVLGSVPAREPSRLGLAIQGATDVLRLTRPAVASGNERRAKTLWEVAADAGLRTAVINWWATWPAPDAASPSNVVLSDRATLRLDVGGSLDAEIAPPALYDRLRSQWKQLRDRAVARASAALAGATPQQLQVLRRSAELDAMQLTLIDAVSTPSSDLIAVYLPGLDIVQYSLFDATSEPVAASALASRLETLDLYYVALDRLLAPVLAVRTDELVMVVACPGRVTSGAPGLLAVGGAAARGQTRTSGRGVDVMPTVLYAIGVPASRELAGTPLLTLFAQQFTRRYPVRQVATYGRPSMPSGARTGQPLDQEMIDRLRSLGYVR